MVYSGSPINWDSKLDKDTIESAWVNWKINYKRRLAPKINFATFLAAIKKGKFITVTPRKFLDMKITGHRLSRYPKAKTAEEAYPPHDRPRGKKDLKIVNYHVKTKNLISPICVARILNKKKKIQLTRLDGSHRLMAAAIRKSPIKVLLIKL